MTCKKDKLLKKYADKPIRAFIQYDGFAMVESDDVINDEDKITGGGLTYDLMSGSDVRVLIEPHIPTKDVLRLLRGIVTEIQGEQDKRKKDILVEAERMKAHAEGDLTIGEVTGVSDQLNQQGLEDDSDLPSLPEDNLPV